MRPENSVIYFNIHGDFYDSKQLATESQENTEEVSKGTDRYM